MPSPSILLMPRWRARLLRGGASGRRSKQPEACFRFGRMRRSRGSGRDSTGRPERGSIAGAEGGAILTKDILFGMNILTLAGFIIMGLTLTLNRMGQAGKALSIGLMTVGTALVFVGLYVGGWSR